MVGGQRVAPGTVVSIAPFVLHRHTSLWSDPDRFDPSRFLPGAAPPARYAYLPFGAGPRICIGARFALTEAVVVLARLLARFRVELAPGSEHVMPRAIVTTQPDRPVRFIVRRGRAPGPSKITFAPSDPAADRSLSVRTVQTSSGTPSSAAVLLAKPHDFLRTS